MLDISVALSGTLKYKDQTPIFKVEVYDTVNTVPSVGVSGYYYATPSGALYTGSVAPPPIWAQNDATMLFNWDNGIPLSLGTTLKIGDQYSVKWFGKFFATEDGPYFFKARAGEGIAASGNTVGFKLDGLPVFEGQAVNLTKNTWHDIDMHFVKPNTSQDGSISFFYKGPRDLSDRLLSADVLSDQAAFLTPTLLSGVSNIEVDWNNSQATTASIQIDNIQNNTQFTWSDTTESFGVLKSNRLVKIYMGYKTQNGEEYVQRFIGLIDSVVPDQSAEGISLNIACRDFSKLLLETIIENFPNKGSYLLPIQMEDTFRKAKAPAYDNWLIREAVIDLCLKAGIDPKYLRTRIDRRMAYRLQWDSIAYPNNFIVSEEETGQPRREEHPYFFQFKYGEKIYDNILKISDLIGFLFFFDPNGNAVFYDPRDEYRIEHYEADTGPIFQEGVTQSVVKTGQHQWIDDSRAANGSYDRLNSINGALQNGIAKISFIFEGIGCSVFIVKESTGDTAARWEIRKIDSSSIIAAGTFDASNATIQFQQEVNLTSSLAFGKYVIDIFNATTSKTLGIEALNVLRSNVFFPKYVFRGNEDITSLGFSQENENIRNDILVIGTPPLQGLPPYGRSVDLNSISNKNSPNYIGRRAVFVLKEPLISDIGHLQWLSDSILSRHRRRHRLLNYQTIGIPHLELIDPIGIVSQGLSMNTFAKNTTYNENSVDLFWLESIRESINFANYSTSFVASSYPPIRSWRPAMRKPNVKIESDGKVTIRPPTEEDIFKNLNNLVIQPGTFDPLSGTTGPSVKISFDVAIPFKYLFVEIWSNDGNRFIRSVRNGGGVTTPGTVTVFWDGVDDGINAEAQDGTYRVYIFGQLDGSNLGAGSEFPATSVLFNGSPSNVSASLRKSPNLVYVWKPTAAPYNSNFPTVTVSTPAFNGDFQFMYDTNFNFDHVENSMDSVGLIMGLSRLESQGGAITPFAEYGPINHQGYAWWDRTRAVNNFTEAYTAVTSKTNQYVAGYGEDREFIPQIPNGFQVRALCNRPGQVYLDVYRANIQQAGGFLFFSNPKKITSWTHVWTDSQKLVKRDARALTMNRSEANADKRIYGSLFTWQGQSINNEYTGPSMYLVVIRLRALRSDESGVVFPVHKKT